MPILLAAAGVLAALGVGSVTHNRFTFTPPAGWQLTAAPSPYHMRCVAHPRDDDSAALSVQETASSLPADRYVQKLLRAMLAAAPQTRLLRQEPFVTTSGLHGYRATLGRAAAGQSVHFVLYAFPGIGGHKFLVAGIWPAADTAKYQAAADASMRTFTIK